MRKENQALNDEIDRLKATYEPQQVIKPCSINTIPLFKIKKAIFQGI